MNINMFFEGDHFGSSVFILLYICHIRIFQKTKKTFRTYSQNGQRKQFFPMLFLYFKNEILKNYSIHLVELKMVDYNQLKINDVSSKNFFKAFIAIFLCASFQTNDEGLCFLHFVCLLQQQFFAFSHSLIDDEVGASNPKFHKII